MSECKHKWIVIMKNSGLVHCEHCATCHTLKDSKEITSLQFINESLQQQLTKSEERVKELEGAIVKHCTASCIDIDGDDNKLKWYLEVNKQD